jgi:ribonuclease P protein component
MLSKARRLNSEEVASAAKKGRRASTGLFSLHILPSSQGKVAVIIPKKLAKTSVLRHKHKRRIISAIGKYPLPSVYIVFTLRQDISKLDFKELCADVREILAKA